MRSAGLVAPILLGGLALGSAAQDFSEALIDGGIVHGQGLAVVDIDGDGDRDTVAALSLTDAVYLYVNGGNSGGGGNGTTWATVPLGPDGTIVAMQVAVADLDGDADLDVAAAGLFDRACAFCSPGEVVWYRNPGNVLAAWTAQPVDASLWGARAIAAADLTGDGARDLIVGAVDIGGNGNGLFWYRNSGNGGSWSAPIPVDAALLQVQSVLVHDVDADGVADILAAGANSGQVAWYENGRTGPNPAPPFTKRVLAALPAPQGLALAALDGDAALELVVASGAGLAWYDPPVPPSAVPWAAAPIDSGFGTGGNANLSPADFNGDGRLDLAASSLPDAQIRWYRREASGSWTMRFVTAGYSGANFVAAGDVDGDGRMDLATSTYGFTSSTDRVAWWRNLIPPVPVELQDFTVE